MKTKVKTRLNVEVRAIDVVFGALEPLLPDARTRVLRYVCSMLGVDDGVLGQGGREESAQVERGDAVQQDKQLPQSPGEADDHELEGVSPVAKRWMTRNSLRSKDLSSIFSLGVDEIDLIAKNVPGKSKREKTHSILLLKGVAAYLGSGVAHVGHEQIKETCLHYGAYDVNNFARYLKDFSSDVSGDKDVGYTLTARGLTAATEEVRAMLASEASKGR